MPKFPFAFGVAESPKGDSPCGAADTLSRGLRRILRGDTCKPIAGSHAAEPMGWISSYLDRRPLPPPRGRGRGKGQMRLRLLLERICAQYGFGFFVQEKSKFVSSTASDRKGLVKGESVPLDRVLPTFARTKVGPRRAGVQMNTFCKTPRRRRRNKAGHSLCRQSLRFAPLTTSLYTREALGTCVQFMPLQKAPRRR